jgi:hypothetical protein
LDVVGKNRPWHKSEIDRTGATRDHGGGGSPHSFHAHPERDPEPGLGWAEHLMERFLGPSLRAEAGRISDVVGRAPEGGRRRARSLARAGTPPTPDDAVEVNVVQRQAQATRGGSLQLRGASTRTTVKACSAQKDCRRNVQGTRYDSQRDDPDVRLALFEALNRSEVDVGKFCERRLRQPVSLSAPADVRRDAAEDLGSASFAHRNEAAVKRPPLKRHIRRIPLTIFERSLP